MTELLPFSPDGPLILRADALAAGYTDREISRLVRGGAWHRVRRGAYVPVSDWASRDDDARHALLALAVMRQARTRVVLSHVSALPEYDAPTWGSPLDVVHLTRYDRRAGRTEAGVHQHQGLLLPDDVASPRGVEVTSPTRTAIDITTVADTEASVVVVNHFLHSKLTTLEHLTERYAAMQHHPFTLRTDLVLRLAHPCMESIGESRTWFMCWHQGLPAPHPQWVVVDGRGRHFPLDFAWPERRTWLEFDGKEKYVKHLREGESVVDAVLREKRREEMIAEITGWRCIRITWADLAHPERTAARIRAVFTQAAAAS